MNNPCLQKDLWQTLFQKVSKISTNFFSFYIMNPCAILRMCEKVDFIRNIGKTAVQTTEKMAPNAILLKETIK